MRPSQAKRAKGTQPAGERASPLMKVTDRTYSNRVLTTPRSHGVVLYFTSRNPQIQCSLCRCGPARPAPPAAHAPTLTMQPRRAARGRRSPGEEEFEALAKAYARWAAGAKPRTPLKFAVVDLENNRQAFGTHQLRRVPIMAYMPPKKSGAVTLKQKNQMDAGEGDLTAATMGAWLSDRTGQSVRGGRRARALGPRVTVSPSLAQIAIVPEPEQMLPLALVATALLATAGGWLVHHPAAAISLPRQPSAWRVFTLVRCPPPLCAPYVCR